MKMRRGDRGAKVRLLQASLKRLGYALIVDGVFGPNTEQAVKRFQLSHGLDVDGVVGPKTSAAIRRELASAIAKRRKPAPLIFLDAGHVGKPDNPADMGASANGLVEAGFYLSVVNGIANYLKKDGYRVEVYAGKPPMSYAERNERANRLGAALYVQLHANAGPPSASYALFEYANAASERAAKAMRDEWSRLTGIEGRVKKLSPGERGHVCIARAKRGVLAEPFFITNAKQALAFGGNGARFAKLIAQAIAAGVR